jgi:hypothetical protein
MNRQQVQEYTDRIELACSRGETLPLDDTAALLVEVKRLTVRIEDFEDSFEYRKLRRERDYWMAHYEHDRRYVEQLVDQRKGARPPGTQGAGVVLPMTATDTAAWLACRHCGTPIRPSESGTYWVDAGEWDNCTGLERSHEPGGRDYATKEAL